MMSIPRIRARVGKVDDPPEWRGQWCFEISVWTLDGETQIGNPIGPFGPYKTKKEATEKMNEAVRMCCERAEIMVDGKPSGKYFDLKNGGVMRRWETN
jgi:hypothetical protein